MAATAPVIKDPINPSDRPALVIHRETGDRKLLTAAEVMNLRMVDRVYRYLINSDSPPPLSWKRQHYFACECCGEGTRLYHHKTGIDDTKTHWSTAPGSKHTNPECKHFEENLNLLVAKGLAAKGNGDFVVNFSSPSQIKPSFDQKARPTEQDETTSDVKASSKDPARLRVKTVQEMEDTFAEIVDALGSDLSHPVYDRVYISFGRQKILVRDAFLVLGEIPKMIKYLSDMTAEQREKGLIFFPVVNVKGLAQAQPFAGKTIIECEAVPISHRGRNYDFQIQIMTQNQDIVDEVREGTITGPQRIAMRIGPGRDPILEMDHIEHEGIKDNRVRLTVQINHSKDIVSPQQEQYSPAPVIGTDGQMHLYL